VSRSGKTNKQTNTFAAFRRTSQHREQRDRREWSASLGEAATRNITKTQTKEEKEVQHHHPKQQERKVASARDSVVHVSNCTWPPHATITTTTAQQNTRKKRRSFFYVKQRSKTKTK
jgi:hypothetical protein